MALELPTGSRRLKRLAAIFAVLGVYVGTTALVAQRYESPPDTRAKRVEVRGGFFYRNGEKFLVKGVGFDPTRPGELPWARHQSAALLDADFARIRAAGFNTVRTWEALSRADLDAAERHGLAVIQGIWIDPDGRFGDPAFQRESVAKIRATVTSSRNSPAILAYLIMNEPRPARVLAEGIDTTRTFFRSLAAAVREEDPGVPVGFANWPGVEFLDEPTLDFAAVNLYPFRPEVLRETIGYEGMVRLWKQRFAPNRPLLISEYGLSVSPVKPKVNDPGGLTEAEQASELPKLADGFMKSGAAGGALFMWIDGWWKNNNTPHDELTHDPADGDEWFGLVAMDKVDDVEGRPRPALEAMQAWNRAVLTLPASGPVVSRETEFEAEVEEPGDVRVEVALNGGPRTLLPTVRDGDWIRGRFGLLSEAHGPQRVELRLTGAHGLVAKFDRLLIPRGEGPTLRIEVEGRGAARTVRVAATDERGSPLANHMIRLAITEASHRYDRAIVLETDAAGVVTLPLQLPPPPDVLQVVASIPAADSSTPLALSSTSIASENSP